MDEEAERRLRDLVQALVNSPEFTDLEKRLCQFNLFEALGVVRAELPHSNFLAALLTSKGSHGLGTLPVKLFLENVLANGENISGLFDGMENIEVLREHAYIDIS